MSFEPDSRRFFEMSRPHESADDANAAIAAFCEDVRIAREKHRITNVLVTYDVNVLYDESGGTAAGHFTFGDQTRHESLAAMSYGALAADARERTAKLLAGTGTKSTKKRQKSALDE